MKSKAILVSLLAIFAVFAVSALVSASDLNVYQREVSIKGVDFNTPGGTVSVDAGETVPIKVAFTAGEDASDVRIKAFISGYRDDITASTGRFDIMSGITYSKLLSLKVPTDVDSDEDYTLTIRIETRTADVEWEFPLKVQRESYNLDVLSVEASRTVTAGSNLAVNVVLKNRGSHRLDDTFVVARIPALNVEKRVYFSDLTPVDQADPDKEDAAERTLFIQVPSDAKAGIYNLEVEASNADVTETSTKSITIVGSEQKSDILAAVSSKEVQAGSTATYDLVIINSGDKIAVYTIVPENAQNLMISVDEPIVTVPADSSRTVKVSVTAGDVMGTFNFAVNVNSEDILVKRVNLSANVSKKAITNNVMVLTVILAIIFVVLLIVLIVLLTRKPEKTEETGESYY